jgi:integrase
VPRQKKQEKKDRGLFQRPPGSGVWWINYYENGKQRREKIGRKSDAIDAYRDRRLAIRRGEKLPDLKRTAPVMVADLVDAVVLFTAKHKSARDYVCKAGILKKHKLAAMNVNSVTPGDIQDFLRTHCKTAATSNRYAAFLGLAFRLGMDNKKVKTNPVRVKGTHQPEPRGRLRFLSREEYDQLCATIPPEHLDEFVVSVHTGMRLSEQYSVEVSQFDRKRRAIDLDRSKNGDGRTVHLNPPALAAIESAVQGRKRTDRIFPQEVRTGAKQERFDTRSWFEPAVAEAGIPRITWHGCRHTFCSWLAMAGASTREIMEAAGHKTLAMAARYAHLSPQHTQSVVDRIAGTK